MAPFFDAVQLRDALRNQVFPVIEALAANENARSRSLRRFERDDPPSYTSSTESEELDVASLMQPRGRPLSEESRAIIERPLSDNEIKETACNMQTILTPCHLYYTECKLEEDRLFSYRCENEILRGEKGARRYGVLVRHYIKHRWEKLGIWNSEWGFPGRNVQSNDFPGSWRWRWQQQAFDDFSAKADRKQLVERALRLRQNLSRGESVPVALVHILRRKGRGTHEIQSLLST
ncbi:hypothetical protein XA68_16699 [Ophiocordyceps unilateralis]|uniref:Uncharacterized protein n=1 Tax=Ophiocordyceps unilateralis TaxID=268505 RepID=A0A2A9P5X3_OPHUN|nr:hypothetical protein XA68_16699 [Ophiocordyceps unilateralis]